MSELDSSSGGYAVVLRTHLWDDFVARQYRRLIARSPSADAFILLDETNGPVQVNESSVVSHTSEELLALGLTDGGAERMLWYNGDYPLYFFYTRFPRYDYYVMVEYDVAVHADIDVMVAHASREGLGLMALTKGEPVSEWPFTPSCLDVYQPEDVQKRLICFSIFSRAAVAALFERRLALSRDYEEGRISRWPFCEAFIPTELARQGFPIGEISIFGSTQLYDWQPPVVETDLPSLQHHAFIHPVLDTQRYIEATLRCNWSLPHVLDPASELRTRLGRIPVRAYAQPLSRAILQRVGRKFQPATTGRARRKTMSR